MKQELASVVRAELNHIYTEPPHFVNGGQDMGWFCREHAIHVFALARLLGHEADIVLGDYVLALANGNGFTSIGDDSDHDWCVVDGVSPVDASVATRYLCPGNPEIGLVYGTELTIGGYSVTCHSTGSEAAARLAATDHRPAIAYIEHKRPSLDPIACLTSPFEFLFPPASGCRTFTEIYGADVFFQITWHCYRLAKGDVRPFNTYRSPKQAILGAVKFNPDARDRIAEILGYDAPYNAAPNPQSPSAQGVGGR